MLPRKGILPVRPLASDLSYVGGGEPVVATFRKHVRAAALADYLLLTRHALSFPIGFAEVQRAYNVAFLPFRLGQDCGLCEEMIVVTPSVTLLFLDTQRRERGRSVRFKAFHVLGHHLLGHAKQHDFLAATHPLCSSPLDNALDQEADAFAREALMPYCVVDQFNGTPREGATLFGVDVAEYLERKAEVCHHPIHPKLRQVQTLIAERYLLITASQLA